MRTRSAVLVAAIALLAIVLTVGLAWGARSSSTPGDRASTGSEWTSMHGGQGMSRMHEDVTPAEMEALCREMHEQMGSGMGSMMDSDMDSDMGSMMGSHMGSMMTGR